MEPQLGQLGMNTCQLVVGEDKARYLTIVLLGKGEGGVGYVREAVVGEVQHGGVRGEGGEGGEALHAAVNQHGVGGGGGQMGGEVVEVTAALVRAEGADMSCVILHNL